MGGSIGGAGSLGASLIFPEAVQSWKVVIYGVLLIVVLVLKPEGIITRPFLTGVKKKVKKIIFKGAGDTV